MSAIMKSGSSKFNSCGSIANLCKNPSQEKVHNTLKMVPTPGKLERDSIEIKQN